MDNEYKMKPQSGCIHSASVFDQLQGRSTMKMIWKGYDAKGNKHELHYCSKCGGFLNDGQYVDASEMAAKVKSTQTVHEK
jgi:hypothetical protein